MKLKKKLLFVALIMLMAIGLIYADVQSPVSNIIVNPNPVYKNTFIYIGFTCNLAVDIVIENEEGNVVKTLYSGFMNSRYFQTVWDRTSDNGSYLPEGIYYLSINYNFKYTSTKKTIILK